MKGGRVWNFEFRVSFAFGVSDFAFPATRPGIFYYTPASPTL
jgi:hypothetical protein